MLDWSRLNHRIESGSQETCLPWITSTRHKWVICDCSLQDNVYINIDWLFTCCQPVPNPFSRMFHNSPKAWHRVEVWMNHFVELIAPFFLLMPHRETRIAGGLIQISFQVVLISSGNLRYAVALFHLLFHIVCSRYPWQYLLLNLCESYHSFLNWLTIVSSCWSINKKLVHC